LSIEKFSAGKFLFGVSLIKLSNKAQLPQKKY